jgi:hypothetical protein
MRHTKNKLAKYQSTVFLIIITVTAFSLGRIRPDSPAFICRDTVKDVCRSLMRPGGPVTKAPDKAAYNEAICMLHQIDVCKKY